MGIFISLCFIIIISTYGGVMLYQWSDDNPTWYKPFSKRYDRLYLSFATFKTLYTVAPDKWDIDKTDHSVRYCNGSWQWFYMWGLIDIIRLRKFANDIERTDSKKEDSLVMEKYLKMWQKDIEDFKEKGLKFYD